MDKNQKAKDHLSEENNFAGYSVMLRGGIEQLTWKQESMIMEVALLANDYERLKRFIH